MPESENKKSGFLWKVNLVYILFLLIGAGVVAAMVKVAFIDGEEWRGKDKDGTFRYENTKAVRGNIYSSDGSLLAVSVPFFIVRMDMHPKVVCNDTFYKYLNPLCDSMSRMFKDKTPAGYRAFFMEGRDAKRRGYRIKGNLTYAQLERMRQFPIFNKGQYKGGFVVETKGKRENPHGDLALRTIGYVNENTKGVGLERYYNEPLKGVDGVRLMQRIAKGIYRPAYSENEIKPENGQDLVTTIDIRIQDVTETALRRCMEENEAEHGCAAVMEVKTGKVVAIANLTKRKDGTYAELMNYAAGEAVEPGSTFKLASTIAILEESNFDTAQIVPTGERQFYNRWMKDSHKGGWGNVSFAKAFAVSSNVGISVVADQVFSDKKEKFVQYLYKMHLGEPLDLEIPGEAHPYIKKPSDRTWSGISLPWMSIGYEVQVTPLQILCLYNAVANNGRMMKPVFVSQIKKGDEVVKTFQPQVLVSEICSKKTLRTVQGLLQGVVERGTATNLKNDLFKVAAKTGTAQMNYNKGQKVTYRASLVGYFPADNPRYSCIIMITNPQKNKIYGGAVAGPVFNEISKKLYATLMQGGMEVNGTKTACNSVQAGGKGEDIRYCFKNLGMGEPDVDKEDYVKISDNGTGEISRRMDAVPDLRGFGLRDAVYLLEERGLKCRVYGCGKVRRQYPAPGAGFTKGETVILELS